MFEQRCLTGLSEEGQVFEAIIRRAEVGMAGMRIWEVMIELTVYKNG